MANLVKYKMLISSPTFYWLILALIICLSAIWRSRNISGFSDNYDEGAHLMEAWLLSQGFRLYEEIFLPLPPLLVQPLAWLFQFTGPSVVSARLLEIAYACLGLVAIAGLGRHFGTSYTGWLAAILLSLSFGYFSLSRISLGNVPATALGVLSLYWGWLYFTNGRQLWLFLAGAAASISLLIKPLFVSAPILLFALLVAYHYRYRLAMKFDQEPQYVDGLNHNPVAEPQGKRILRDGFFLTLGLVLPFLLILMVYNAPAMINQVIVFRYELAQSQVKDISLTLERLTYFLNNSGGLPLLAITGLVWLFMAPHSKERSAHVTQPLSAKMNDTRLYQKWFVMVWLCLTLSAIFGFESLHSHHLVSLEPVLALLGALAIGYMVRNLNRSTRPLLPKLMVLVTIAAIVQYFRYLPNSIAGQMEALPQAGYEEQENWQAVQLVKKVTSANEYVLSDDLFLAFEAQRRVPPWISDPSEAALDADYIEDETAIQLADQHAQAVIAWNGRFHDKLPLFMQWVERNFRESVAFGDNKIIYFDKELPQIPVPIHVDVGNVLRIEGYDFRATEDNGTILTLFWRKLAEDSTDYVVTIRLLDKNKQQLAQVDVQPFQGHYPTSDWPVDILLWDTFSLDLPLTSLSQADKLLIGVYDPNTLQLLPIPGTPANFIEVLVRP